MEESIVYAYVKLDPDVPIAPTFSNSSLHMQGVACGLQLLYFFSTAGAWLALHTFLVTSFLGRPRYLAFEDAPLDVLHPRPSPCTNQSQIKQTQWHQL
jgi:hypothetical protein